MAFWKKKLSSFGLLIIFEGQISQAHLSNTNEWRYSYWRDWCIVLYRILMYMIGGWNSLTRKQYTVYFIETLSFQVYQDYSNKPIPLEWRGFFLKLCSELFFLKWGSVDSFSGSRQLKALFRAFNWWYQAKAN